MTIHTKRIQNKKTHKPVRFVKDLNEVGRSPVKLLNDKSLVKEDCISQKWGKEIKNSKEYGLIV